MSRQSSLYNQQQLQEQEKFTMPPQSKSSQRPQSKQVLPPLSSITYSYLCMPDNSLSKLDQLEKKHFLDERVNPLQKNMVSELSKVATKVNQKFNVYNETEDEIHDQLINKFENDQNEEVQIKTLEQQIHLMKDQLDNAKYKYEKRQLYELEKKEKELLDRVDDLEKQAIDDHDWSSQIRDRLI